MKKSSKYILNLFIILLCILQVNACGVINKADRSQKEALDEEYDENEEDEVDKKEAKKKKGKKNKKKQKNESSETAVTKEVQSNANTASSNSFSEADYSEYYNQIDYAASEINPKVIYFRIVIKEYSVMPR